MDLLVDDNNEYITVKDIADILNVHSVTATTYLNGYRFTKYATSIKVNNRPKKVYEYSLDFLEELQEFYITLHGYCNKRLNEIIEEKRARDEINGN